MKQKYLFFDIDGTLVDPKTGTVPRSASDAIRKAQENGSLVLICSGRPYYEIQETFGIQRDGAIFSSGAGFELNGKLVLKRVFTPELAKFVIDKADECHIGYNIHCLAKGFSDPLWRKMVFDRLEGLPASIANRLLVHPVFNCGNLPMDKYAGEDIYKINVQYFPGADRETFEKAIAPLTTYVPINSQSNNSNSGGEVSPIDVNKGTGVLMVVTHYQGDMADTYGFGDSLNDLEMIKECSHGIVMGNGQDEVKALAEFVTTNVDEDGIANALRHFGLCE